MLKALLKKQIAEIFQNILRSRKTGKTRTGAARIAAVIGFALILVGVLGGTFAFFAAGTISQLITVGAGWLYMIIFAGAAFIFGLFGSVFNTFSTLYQAKDNDLLLSMPIPSRVILTARLAAVYVMGLIYSSIVMIPAIIVYIVKARPGFGAAAGCFAFLIPLSLLILTFSCALGWVVAKISAKLKNKSFFTVIIAVAFMALYYFLYFKAQGAIAALVQNGAVFASQIKESAYPVYAVGTAACGNPVSLLIVTAAVAAVLLLTCFIMSRGFIRTVTVSGGQTKKEYVKKELKTSSADGALFSKELKRFTSSPAYMLNAGTGTLFMIVAGVAVLIKGGELSASLVSQFGRGTVIAIASAALCFLVSTNFITAPSISLEGRSIWLPQSLPVSAWQVLRSKLAVHLAVTEIPALFCGICMWAVLRPSVAEGVLLVTLPLAFGLFTAAFGLFVNLMRPNLNWISETAVIKQSLSAFLVMIADMILSIAFIVLWFILRLTSSDAVFYMLIWLVVFAACAGIFLALLKKKGPEVFRSL